MFDPAHGPDGTDAEAAVAEQPLAVGSAHDRPIAITGAAGFVGTHLCAILAAAGRKVRALVHTPATAAARLAHLPVELSFGDIRDSDYLATAFDEAAAVVHLAAIAIERGDATYEDVNTRATRLVIDAAQNAKVDRFVYMSQNGADSRSPYRFLRSKGTAQDMVTGSTLDWTVLRPSVIFGPEDEFGNVLARLVKLTPLIFPLPAGGYSRFQPVCVDDVAMVIARALDDDSTIRGMYSLGGPAILTLREMAERILAAMRARRTIIGVPIAMIRPLVAVLQRIVPNPPVTTSLLDILAVDNTVPDNAIASTFGVQPTPFAPEELLYLQHVTARSAMESFFRH